MVEVAVQAENLGKRYRIGGRHESYGTLRDTLASAAPAAWEKIRGKRRSRRSTIWALQDVSLSVPRGEVLGIIGANGSGKTTLLKILARVTRPTTGRAWVRGRVAALLEVGTGFHPELTGRENVYLNGAILGMKKTEIDRKFDDIVTFAEAGVFLDTPVKRYSTGMFMRLAFAVAAYLEPEILIVDEVLAVGDAAFQKKSLGQMGDVAREGRTVLFVSHNMTAIQALCDSVIWLDHGRVVAQGASQPTVNRYLQTADSNIPERVWDERSAAPGNEHVRLRRVSIRPAGGDVSDPITMRTPVVLEVAFWNLVPGSYLDPYVQLITDQGVVAFESSPGPSTEWYDRPYPAGLFTASCVIPGDLLIAGRYRVLVSLVRDDHHALFELHDAVVFDVQDAPELRDNWYGEMVGVVRPRLEWSTAQVEEQAADHPTPRSG